MASIEHLIAKRYLVSKRSIRFIHMISLVSVVGITIGVAALLIVLSVFNGFYNIVTEVLVGFDPHLRIEKKGTFDKQEIMTIEAMLARTSYVTGYSKFITGKAMLVAGARTRVVYIRALEQDRISFVSGLPEKIVLGSMQFQDTVGIYGIILGLNLADRLGRVVGDELQIISPMGFQTALTSFNPPQTVRFRVTAIYESNNKDYDANYAFISLDAAQHLFNLEEQYNGLEVRLSDFHRSESVKEEILSHFPEDIFVSTWYDLHKSLYDMMKIEHLAAYFLISLIILVAAFNMVGSLMMGVVEKRRDIGVLKSMGLSAKRIVRIFMVEGMFIGFIGTIFGIAIGLIVLYLQIHYSLFPLDPTVYIIPAIPVSIVWTDFIAVAISSLGFSFLASYYPARRAAMTIPSEAIRWE